MKRWVTAIFLILLLLNVFISDSQSLPSTSTISFHSKILNEDRKLSLYTPLHFKQGTTYPVLFLFDAESLFIPLVGAVNFMNYSSSFPQIPEAYIIGVHNNKRDMDMPPPQDFEKTTGAKNFYKFLSEELVPYAKQHFASNGLHVLIGHSQGGLFATYAGLENPKLFPLILSMDAPVTVNKNIQSEWEGKIKELKSSRYFSAESIFGWDKNFANPQTLPFFSTISIEGESHETMPYKAMYEGLKFLFREFMPLKSNASLQILKKHYQDLSIKYGASLQVPSKVLIQSAKENIAESKKAQALELLNYHKQIFGIQKEQQLLFAKANAIIKTADTRVDDYLNHPQNDSLSFSAYRGKWKGIVHVPGGSDMTIEWVIRKRDQNYIMDARVEDQFNSVSDFLFISEQNELIWGRKHNGGGIYVSIGKLSEDSKTISGEEDLIGFDYPEGMEKFKKNTFVFRKVE